MFAFETLERVSLFHKVRVGTDMTTIMTGDLDEGLRIPRCLRARPRVLNLQESVGDQVQVGASWFSHNRIDTQAQGSSRC